MASQPCMCEPSYLQYKWKTGRLRRGWQYAYCQVHGQFLYLLSSDDPSKQKQKAETSWVAEPGAIKLANPTSSSFLNSSITCHCMYSGLKSRWRNESAVERSFACSGRGGMGELEYGGMVA